MPVRPLPRRGRMRLGQGAPGRGRGAAPLSCRPGRAFAGRSASAAAGSKVYAGSRFTFPQPMSARRRQTEPRAAAPPLTPCGPGPPSIAAAPSGSGPGRSGPLRASSPGRAAYTAEGPAASCERSASPRAAVRGKGTGAVQVQYASESSQELHKQGGPLTPILAENQVCNLRGRTDSRLYQNITKLRSCT